MDCVRSLLSPCVRCCPCRDDRQLLLLGSRRSALSVSTHDDDWDAEVGFDSKNYNAQFAKRNRNATMDREMEVQLQHLSHDSARAMHNVAVTEEDESEILGSTSSNIDIVTAGSQSQSNNHVSWRSYKASAISTEEEAYSSGSDRNGQSGQNSPSATPSTDFGFANRRPYRDTPYSDSIPPTHNSPKDKGNGNQKGSGGLGPDEAVVALNSQATPAKSYAAAAASSQLTNLNNTVKSQGGDGGGGADDDNDDEEVEISLL